MTERSFKHILFETDHKPVALIRLNRPKVLNALNSELMEELGDLLEELDRDDEWKVAVITGSERAFAAGADIDEMAELSAVEMLKRDHTKRWERIQNFRKPLIAAVAGYALGGGNELVIQCDLVIAAENAKFGQPEIKIGVMPGAGGTQRLTRQVGKVRAMEMILTGEFIDAKTAYQWGLVNKVVPTELVVEEALEWARKLAELPPVALMLAKDAVRKAWELSLSEGLEYERKLFYMLFSTEDQKEGMRAFAEKRRPEWKGS